MENALIQWLPAHPIPAFLLSVTLNIVIAISGVLPSAFITAANIALFGFQTGLLISIIGEAAGAVVSFILYRKGLKKFTSHMKLENKFLNKLQNTKGIEAVFLVIFLRVLPFVPSGAVTLTAAFSKMGLFTFSIASTAGKIPSLFIEAYSVERIFDLTVEWQLFILFALMSCFMIYTYWKRKNH
ncbi:VTT domain-containing protein [Bacillus sp. B190/17]|uniref:TVP38/TMEM64 family membrane protein n=1 Tax=Bacillus lumedeiriae TaxID=3058829 RepID=A0ABW8I7K4_9BACI